MRVWILDDGPFGRLALSFQSSWAWPRSVLHMVEEVASTATVDRSGRRQRLLALTDDGAPCVEVHRILVGSAAADYLLSHLRPSSKAATKDLGEHASIAYCAIDRPDAIFVTMDKSAAYLGLAELGVGRVSTPYDLWDEMRAEGLVSSQEFVTLCDGTRASDSSGAPLPYRYRGPVP